MHMVLITVTVLMLPKIPLCQPKIVTVYCSAGQYFDRHDERCRECSENTWMAETHHRHTKCEPSRKLQPDDPYYNIIFSGNKTHKAVIKCSPGYFDSPYFTGEPCSRECTNCTAIRMFFAKACTDNQDSICCPEKGMRVVNGSCKLVNASTYYKTKKKENPGHVDQNKQQNNKGDDYLGITIAVTIAIITIAVIAIFAVKKWVVPWYQKRHLKQDRRTDISLGEEDRENQLLSPA
ncbi:hypothetical protein PoB_005390900 [Plakobranchus ocellatus]|uniref:TNFR-Cys domain-containing protein n=1 Tax=Plakobranchus ocellatus TaxID=259542 RepID=A0AAV4C9P5_9GAST|nr:hypothetical protein PoB_005390900 [Plakobranchus ocellatus]